MKPAFLSFILSIFILFTGCNHSWTAEEKLAMKNKCESIDTMPSLYFLLSGFKINEIDTIYVREKHANILLDSFLVSASQDGPRGDYYYCSINKTFRLENTFEILIPNQPPHVFSGIRWGMEAHYTNNGEDYGCDLNTFYLDGELNGGIITKE